MFKGYLQSIYNNLTENLYEKIEEIDYLFPETSIKKQNSTELFKKIKEDVVKKEKIA